MKPVIFMLMMSLALACVESSGVTEKDIKETANTETTAMETSNNEVEELSEEITEVTEEIKLQLSVTATQWPEGEIDDPAVIVALKEISADSKTVTVDVILKDPGSICGAAFKLTYDPALLKPADAQVKAVVEGSAWSKHAVMGEFTDSRPAFIYGNALLRDDMLSPQESYMLMEPLTVPTKHITGAQLMVRLTFTVLDDGEQTLILTQDDVSVRDAWFNPVPVNLYGLKITIAGMHQ